VSEQYHRKRPSSSPRFRPRTAAALPLRRARRRVERLPRRLHLPPLRGPLAPFLKQAFDLSNAQIGGLTSATAVTYAPTLILAGWLVDRIGVRRALVIGSLVTVVFVGAVALAPSCGVMLLLLGLSGLGCGFIYPSAVKAVML